MILTDEQHLKIIFGLSLVLVIYMAFKQPRRASSGAFGTAQWMIEWLMYKLGYFAGRGLVIGRALKSKRIISIPSVHTLVVGATGSGKGVSFVIVNLLRRYFRSAVAFDPKGELEKFTARRRGGKIVVLNPYKPKADKLNPLDYILNDRHLVDKARALANAMIVRTGQEHEGAHFNDRAEQLITACIVFVCLEMTPSERHLASVYRLLSSKDYLLVIAQKLHEKGGIYAQIAGQVLMLFEAAKADNGQVAYNLSREGASVVSTALRHMGWVCSEAVAASVSSSTFRIEDLIKKRMTVYIQLPTDLLASSTGYLRVLVATFINVLSQIGSERNEVFFMLDEAVTFNGLAPLEQTLVLGRSAGIRLALIYQSDSQVTSAFPQKPTLLYDNCSTQLYLSAGLDTAKRLSETLGNYTQSLSSYQTGRNSSLNWNNNGTPGSGGQGVNAGYTYSEGARALLDPAEVLKLDSSLLICLVRGQPPILARRIIYYRDSAFR